jgi:hypothetical protein
MDQGYAIAREAKERPVKASAEHLLIEMINFFTSPGKRLLCVFEGWRSENEAKEECFL